MLLDHSNTGFRRGTAYWLYLWFSCGLASWLTVRTLCDVGFEFEGIEAEFGEIGSVKLACNHALMSPAQLGI